jgi:hypothetical protein
MSFDDYMVKQNGGPPNVPAPAKKSIGARTLLKDTNKILEEEK